MPAKLLALISRCVLAVLLLVPAMVLAADNADTLKNADKQFNSDTRSHGLEGWLRWFAADGYVGNDPGVRGGEELRKYYQNLFSHKDLRFEWSPAHGELFPSGTLGYTTGRYTLTFIGDDGKPVSRTGNYLTVWQKQKDGSWKVMSDFGSVDGPQK